MSSHSPLIALLKVSDVIHGCALVAIDDSHADLTLTFAKDGVAFDIEVKAESGWIMLSRQIRAAAAQIPFRALAA
jgi:hypothetical protein